MTKKAIELECSFCASTDVIQKANAYWNAENQEYDFDNPDDDGLDYCNNCDDSATINSVDYLLKDRSFICVIESCKNKATQAFCLCDSCQKEADIENSKEYQWSVVRFCVDTDEAMVEGWCWGNGEAYNKYKVDVVADFRKEGNPYRVPGDILAGDADEILEWAVSDEIDLCYWTDWFDDYKEALTDENEDISDTERACIERLLKGL